MCARHYSCIISCLCALTADFEDFDSEIQTLWFKSSSESCVNISLREDNMVEDDSTLLRESFRVTLESNNDYTVLFGEPKSARVFIIDNDGK